MKNSSSKRVGFTTQLGFIQSRHYVFYITIYLKSLCYQGPRVAESPVRNKIYRCLWILINIGCYRKIELQNVLWKTNNLHWYGPTIGYSSVITTFCNVVWLFASVSIHSITTVNRYLWTCFLKLHFLHFSQVFYIKIYQLCY